MATITRPTVEHVIAAPMPELLAELNAQIIDISSIDHPGFYGQLVVKRSGEVILAMPVDRDPVERDAAARMLLAHHLGLSLNLFPAHMETTDVTKDGAAGP